jgi:hypothetical protein
MTAQSLNSGTRRGGSCLATARWERFLATNKHKTIEELLRAEFSMQSEPSLCNENQWDKLVSPRVEAGSNTSTESLRVVGGDEKGPTAWEYNWANLQVGQVSNLRHRIREWLRWLGPAAVANDRPVLSSERAPHIIKPASVWQIWSWAPDGYWTPRQTGRMTVGRNRSLTLTLKLVSRRSESAFSRLHCVQPIPSND